jgi:hypothetical protein
VNTVMNLRVPQVWGRSLNSCSIGGLSSSVQLHALS